MAAKSKRASAQTVSPVLRCRKGDLAILLEGRFTGYIVDVVEYYPTVELSDGEVLVNAWHIRHPSDEPGVQYFKLDKYLLPIRPGELAESETEELSQGVAK